MWVVVAVVDIRSFQFQAVPPPILELHHLEQGVQMRREVLVKVVRKLQVVQLELE
jgi:hypothetical protein